MLDSKLLIHIEKKYGTFKDFTRIIESCMLSPKELCEIINLSKELQKNISNEEYLKDTLMYEPIKNVYAEAKNIIKKIKVINNAKLIAR